MQFHWPLDLEFGVIVGHVRAISVMANSYLILLSLTAMIGSMGGLMIFVSDKQNGVYEYLLSYGYRPITIFRSILIASIELATLVLLIATPVSAIMSIMMGGSLNTLPLLLYFSLPISYASVMPMMIMGMIWSSITVRRPGVNSPVGLAPPVFGIIPIVLTELLSILVPGLFLTVEVIIAATILAIAGLLLALVSRGMLTSERLLPSS